MSHLLGLCCCNACENCRRCLRVRLPRCFGGQVAPEGLGELELGTLQQPTEEEAEPSSVFEVVTHGPSATSATGRTSAPPTAEAGVGTEAKSTTEASAQTQPPKTSRPGYGDYPVGTVYLSHVCSDMSLSSDPQTEPSTLASMAVLACAKRAEEDTSPEEVSGMEMASISAGADQDQLQSSSASEPEEQAEKP
ncbi:uncharacterized protein LOC119464587 [Dermacentor silvarum]|uniref:uncharacterized protein LOC119464587 n=1 Tax=Dermacentor silvarum TaxID=543639 RepID=UPI00189A1981|nr:uncharacterized protein LOC119464587 [Dermacentor silvarum]